ncbi:uncharacterized protein LOC109862081 isoform X2 [Pseudomyrmex gracilis]|uniref:uncharacterized protein LOC109862081 isoform X2 n=1 Tax=Pseudomyrmex gracilis TaxID=219809 RepID=UPI00099507C4|nr:uncharacterized protein LOC109862081 isoform X2 [Pseudomyrmex gracilis]
MDKSTNDCFDKRQTSSRRRVEKPFSSVKIIHSKNEEKKRKSKPKERWPFYRLTVDELARYRKRKVQNQPKDYFQSDQKSITQNLASEYRRAFGINIGEVSEENTWLVKDITEKNKDNLHIDALSSYHIDFKKYKAMEKPPATNENASQLTNRNEKIKITDTLQVKSFERSLLKRRSTSLKCDGEFYTDTETFSAYIPYEGRHRPELARRSTFLKMEGDLNTMTEKCEKFIEWLSVSRPSLMRVPTHLKMEGELETETENKNKYVPFVGVRRPELLRRNTNLKLEGNIFFVPEYTDVFRDYKIQNNNDRLQSKESHLHSILSQSTESAKELLRETAEQLKDNETNKYTKDQEENRKNDEEMQMLVSKLEHLNDRPLETPEYRDAYKDFPREQPTIVKPNNVIGRADGSKVFSPPFFKFSAKIDQDPEYQSHHQNYPRDQPIYRKSSSLLRPTVAYSSTRHSACFDSSTYDRDYPTFKYEPTCESECKSSYCEKYDYRSFNDFKTTYRKCDQSATRKNEDELNDNNNREYDDIIIPESAFCVLNTRIDEKNKWKPPSLISTRNYRFNQVTMPSRSTRSELVDRSLITARYVSPTYRLHMCNVDNESQSSSQLKQSSEKACNSSTDTAIQNDVAKPYSPSFGKNRQNRRIDHPFVVLDNALKDTRKPQTDISCSNHINRNVNVIPISRKKPKTPTKWMPLWYDNTNAI